MSYKVRCQLVFDYKIGTKKASSLFYFVYVLNKSQKAAIKLKLRLFSVLNENIILKIYLNVAKMIIKFYSNKYKKVLKTA